jgi:DNA-binding CsgD family transcriptional regulator
MRILAQNDIDEVLMVSNQANECSSFSELQAATLQQLEQIYQTSGCIFGLCKGDSFGDVTIERFAERGLDEDYVSLYVSKFRKFDTLVRSMHGNSGTALPNAMMAAQSVSYDEFVRSKIYREYFSCFSIHHILCINLIFNKRPFGFIGLYRSRRQDGFSQRDLVKAELIASSLSGSAYSMLSGEKLENQVDITDALSGKLSFNGVMVLNEELTPLYMDAQARSTMSVLWPGEKHEERSFQWGLNVLRRLCVQSAEASSFGTGAGHTACVISTPGDSRRISCDVHVLRRVGKAPLFLICFEPKAPSESLSERMIEAGLTPREISVVFAVSSGLTNRQIAETLSISISTVQTHLRSIYRKLGIRNRTGLIHHFVKLI